MTYKSKVHINKKKYLIVKQCQNNNKQPKTKEDKNMLVHDLLRGSCFKRHPRLEKIVNKILLSKILSNYRFIMFLTHSILWQK